MWEQLGRQTVVFTRHRQRRGQRREDRLGRRRHHLGRHRCRSTRIWRRFQPPALQGVEARIAVGVLRFSRQPTAALQLRPLPGGAGPRPPGVRDATATRSVRGRRLVGGAGAAPAAGAMLRPAVEQTILAFERREGCRVTRVYNGCGILVAQMKAGERPDAYFACDASFMDAGHRPVPGPRRRLRPTAWSSWSPRATRTASPAGRPGQPGLRVGVGHEKQCALGALTQKTLEQGRLREAVMKNVKCTRRPATSWSTSCRTGSLDAVIAYVSNAAAARRPAGRHPHRRPVRRRDAAGRGRAGVELQPPHRPAAGGAGVAAVQGAVRVAGLSLGAGAITRTPCGKPT